MRTVKEVSAMTGISVRTLHYYDEIGLLRPTACSEAGYRLYDDRAIEKLQQILFFREFDLPLKTIKTIMDNPALDTQAIWRTQRRMLEQKATRLARLIEGIDGILKGENPMDFAVFEKEEIEELYRAQVAGLAPEMRAALERRYGSMEAFHADFMRQAGGEQAQREYRKIVEWYGGKDEQREVMLHPQSSAIAQAYGKRMDAAYARLAQRREEDVRAFPVKEIVGEIDFLTKQLFRVKTARELMLAQASAFAAGGESAQHMDEAFGAGAAAFFARAIEAFYES